MSESDHVSSLDSSVACSTLNTLLVESYLHDKKPDVYMHNYFEDIVPYYSDITYRRHFRMSQGTMAVLIDELKGVLTKQGTDVNSMIVSLSKKTHVTIWMLANYAVTYRECGTLFGLSTGTIHFIFMQICTALGVLQARYVKWPNVQQCEVHAAEIFENTGFPGVIGYVDKSRIEIKARFHSVILQGTCDKDLKFIDIFIGTPETAHNARVFSLSPLHHQITLGLIQKDMHILADSACDLHENVLTPFRDNGHLTPPQIRYNFKHSGIRSATKRTFGLLKNKFRRLRYLDLGLEAEIPTVILACCVLHNFILSYEGYEDGEDISDVLDEVPDLQGSCSLETAGGCDKRSIIANTL